MKFSVDDLKALPSHRLTLEFKEDIAGLDAIKPVVGELTLVWSATGVKLFGWVKTLLKLNCDRCLGPYFQSLTVDIDEKFVPEAFADESEREPQRELLKDDFVETLPSSGVLDISDIVYQAVTLAKPSYCLCGDQCPGPPGSGKSGQTGASGLSGGAGASSEDARPVDPRWKNLKTLFPNDDSKENS